MRPHRQRFHEQGVTALELVIAVALVVVLAGLILPVLSHVRQTGLTARCVSNLRQLYQATLAYTEDYDGLLPPPLGKMLEVDERYLHNNYWWQQPYLAPYAVGPRHRLKDSRGKLTQAEAEIYNCPARFPDGPDAWYAHSSNGNPGISYLMTPLPAKRSSYLLRTMENQSQRIYLAEGRGNTVVKSTFKTGKIGSQDTVKRLRRFHGNSLNLLFYDGHIELSSAPDEELQAFLK